MEFGVKLPISRGRDFRDSPAKNTIPAGGQFYNTTDRAYNERLIQLYDVNYDESVLVGYRWYDTKGIEPLFPFGHGLSYTSFELTDPSVKMKDGKIHVEVTLRNTGNHSGAEVVQFYSSEIAPTVVRPEKELRDFVKVHLNSGEKRKVAVDIDPAALGFWDDNAGRWQLNHGDYILRIGTSSRCLPLSVSLAL